MHGDMIYRRNFHPVSIIWSWIWLENKCYEGQFPGRRRLWLFKISSAQIRRIVVFSRKKEHMDATWTEHTFGTDKCKGLEMWKRLRCNFDTVEICRLCGWQRGCHEGVKEDVNHPIFDVKTARTEVSALAMHYSSSSWKLPKLAPLLIDQTNVNHGKPL